MLRIDASNIQSRNNAEITNARIQGREEDARVKDNLSFEQRQLRADETTRQDFNNFFNKNQEVNVRNYREVMDTNFNNASHDRIQFDGQGFIVAPKPNFSNTLNAQNIAKMRDLVDKYDEDNKKKTN
jgi:hypothetical protein